MDIQSNKRQREEIDMVDSYLRVTNALNNYRFRRNQTWNVVLHHKIGHYLSMLQSPFACEGSLNFQEMSNPTQITVKDEEGVEISCGTLKELDILKLKSMSKPSPFGKGTETVYDENVRLAFEIPAKNLSLPKFLSHSFCCESTSRMAPRGYYFHEKLHKLNIYEKGGFFQDHVDTLHGPGHIATAVACLPSEFSGGELVVTDGKREMVFDFAKNSKDTNNLQWAVMFTDCRHSVKPVTSGTRVTLQYDLYLKPQEDIEESMEIGENFQSNIKLSIDPLLNSEINMKALGSIKEKLFQVNLNKGSVGLLLHHRYPNYVKIDQLKGPDALLMEYLKNDFNVEVQPIILFYESDYDGSDNNDLKAYQFSSKDIENATKRTRIFNDSDEEEEKDSKEEGSEEKDSNEEGNDLVIENIEGGLNTSENKVHKEGNNSDSNINFEEKKDEEGIDSDLSEYHDKNEEKKKGNESVVRNKMEPGMLFCGSNRAHIDCLKSTPYIEHTGNEAQKKENYYYGAALIIRRKKYIDNYV